MKLAVSAKVINSKKEDFYLQDLVETKRLA